MRGDVGKLVWFVVIIIAIVIAILVLKYVGLDPMSIFQKKVVTNMTNTSNQTWSDFVNVLNKQK